MEKGKLTRRRFLQSSAVATLGATIAACAPAAPAPTTTPTTASAAEPTAVPAAVPTAQPTPAPAQPVEVTWYVRSNPGENPWQRDQVIPRFQEMHPEIKVKLIVTPQTEAVPKLLAMISAGTAPDIWANNFGAGFTAGLGLGAIRPLSDHIDLSSSIKLDDYGKPVIDLFTRAGKVWAIPFMTCGSFVFYNKDLFDQAGVQYPSFNWDDRSWTWERMVETAGKLTKNYGQGADAQYGLLYWTWAGWQHLQWLWGVDAFKPDDYKSGYPCKINLTSEKALEAYQAGVDLIYKDKVAPPPAQVDAISAAGDPFRSGKVAMSMSGGWGFWGYRNFTTFKWGAAAIPWVATNTTILWPDANMIAKVSKVANAAWKLLEYVSVGEGLKGFIQATEEQPAPRSSWDDWYALFQDKVPLEELKAGMEGSVKYGRIPHSHTMAESDRMDTILTQQFDSLWLGEKSAKEVASAAEAEVNKALAGNCGKTLEDAAKSVLQSL